MALRMIQICVPLSTQAAKPLTPALLSFSAGPKPTALNPAQSSAFRDLPCVLHNETPWFMLEV